MPDYLPRRDADLAAWAGLLARRVAEEPGALGASAARAAALLAAERAYAQAYARTAVTTLRCVRDTLVKNEARAALRAEIRRVVGVARADPAVSDAALAEVGLRRRRADRAPRVRVPAAVPTLRVRGVEGRRVFLELGDAASPRRGKPRGAEAIQVWAAPWAGPGGPEPALRWAGQRTRPRFEVEFGPELPPAQRVLLAAQWSSPTNENGPMSRVVDAHLGCEGGR